MEGMDAKGRFFFSFNGSIFIPTPVLGRNEKLKSSKRDKRNVNGGEKRV